MTTLGKTLVLVIVALSIPCFLFGLGIYSYSIDWGWTTDYTRKVFDQKIASEIGKRQAVLAELADAQNRALIAWKRAQTELAKTESTIASRQLQYTRELERIQAGESISVEDLNHQKPWLFKKNPRTGKPFFDSDATKSYHGYITDLNAVLTKVNTVRTQINKVMADQKRLTEELIGKDEGGGKQGKGLYALITMEQDVQKRAREEVNDLKPLYYQELIAGQVLRDRQDSLRYRLQELENLKTTKK